MYNSSLQVKKSVLRGFGNLNIIAILMGRCNGEALDLDLKDTEWEETVLVVGCVTTAKQLL